MLTIIHGDDTKASRTQFITLKQEVHSAVSLDGNSMDLTSFTEALSGEGLFEENKDVFIELFLTKRKKSKVLDELIDLINKNADKNIILWEGKEVDKKTLSLFPKASIRLHKLPQILFTFLDAIKPNNGKALLKLYHQALETSEAELLFAMILRQFRLLLALSDHTENPIDEVKRLAPWQQQKLKKQSALFSKEYLITLYHDLFELDYFQKTGRLSQPLSSTIDIWLLKL